MQSTTARYDLWAKRIALLLVLSGIGLRVIVYFQNRSLFLDEANLIRNIIEQPFSGLFAPLNYHQYAPPLFGVIEKGFWQLLGSTELGLRFFPLLLGIATLLLFYELCRKIDLYPAIWWFPLFLMAFSVFFLRYATEVKQYGADAFSTCLLLLLALQHPPERFRRKQILLWALLGTLIIWFSMPSVFLLSGIGLYYLFGFWKTRNRINIQWMLLLILGWLLSFGIYYTTILSADLTKDFLLDYHSVYFIPLFPGSISEWSKLGSIILSLFNTTVGYTVWAYIMGIGLFLTGVFYLYRNSKAELILFVVPILATLLASGLKLYSLMPRLSIFLIPILLLIIAKGAHFFWLNLRPGFRLLLMLSMLSLLPMQKGLLYFSKPFQIEEIRPVLVYVHEKQADNELVYLHEDAIPAWQYYHHLHHRNTEFQLKNVFPASGYQKVDEVLPQLKDQPVWLVFSHLLSGFSRQQVELNQTIMEKTHQLSRSFEVQGAAAYFYLPKQ